MMHPEINPSLIHTIEPSQILVYHRQEDSRSIDLLSFLHKNYLFILFIMMISTAIAIGCTFIAKPQYKISTHLVEPTNEQYHNLYTNTGSKITQAQLFNLFLNKLANSQNFASFLEKNESMATLQKSTTAPDIGIHNKSNLKSRVSINLNKDLLQEGMDSELTNNSTVAELNILSPEAIANDDLNKAYIDYTNHAILSDIAIKQREIIGHKIERLEQKIKLQIAIVRNFYTYNIEKFKNQLDYLKAEKDTLNYKRLLSDLAEAQYKLRTLTLTNKSDNKEFLQQESELQQLISLSFDTSNIQSFNVEGTPLVIKSMPNKKMIIMLGIIFGFMGAVFLVILRNTLKVRKELKLLVKSNATTGS